MNGDDPYRTSGRTGTCPRCKNLLEGAPLACVAGCGEFHAREALAELWPEVARGGDAPSWPEWRALDRVVDRSVDPLRTVATALCDMPDLVSRIALVGDVVVITADRVRVELRHTRAGRFAYAARRRCPKARFDV